MKVQRLAAELAAGKTSSRELVEAALARIARSGGRRAARLPEGVCRHRRAPMPTCPTACAAPASCARRSKGLPVSVKDLFDVAGDVTRAGSTLLADAAPAERDATGGRAVACGRRRDRRAHQHGRIRVRRRRPEPALRHAEEPVGPLHRPRAGRLVVGRRRGAGRWHVRDVARHRHARLGAHSGRAVRRRRLQADGAARADATAPSRCRGRSIRWGRSPIRSTVARLSMRSLPATAPSPLAPLRRSGLRLLVPAGERDGRSRHRGRARLRCGVRRAVARRRSDRQRQPVPLFDRHSQ